MPRITMSVIAARAGVSKNTVSLALRHDPQISERTRERIGQIARELGYTCHPVVAQLMSELRKAHPAGAQRTLGLLNANLDPCAFTRHPTVPDYVAGCRRQAAWHGYGLDEFWLHDPRLNGETLDRILRARGIRGLLVVGLMRENRLPTRFASTWERHAVVVTGVRTREPTLSFACVDHHALVLEALEQVGRLGYRRPALVLEHTIDRLVDFRFSAGFQTGQRQLPAQHRVSGFHALEAARAAPERFHAWYRSRRPDVILTLHTVVREWLDAIQVRAPSDVGLVQLERRRGCADWSGMEQHNDLTGEAAVDLLITLLHRAGNGRPACPRASLLGASWAAGSTTRLDKAELRVAS